MPRNTPALVCNPRPMHRRASLTALVGALCLASAAGCASALPARSSAIDRIELVKSATFDHGCPEQDIRVLREDRSPAGAAVFIVDVCGTKRHYTRIGSMYFDADRSGS